MCSHKQLPCYGKINVNVNGTLTISSNHSHPPDIWADEKEIFKKDLRHAVQYGSPTTSFKIIYDNLSAM